MEHRKREFCSERKETKPLEAGASFPEMQKNLRIYREKMSYIRELVCG